MDFESQNPEHLFVNKDVNSISLSNSRPDLSRTILRHVQSRNAQIRRLQKKEALGPSSDVVEKIRIVGWKLQSADGAQANSHENPNIPDEAQRGVYESYMKSDDASSEDSSTEEGKRRIEDRRIISWRCGRGGAVDPFTSTAMTVDSMSMTLLPFFTEWWKHTSWGWTWGRFQGSESVVAITVRRSMCSESHMLALLTYTALMRDTVQPGNISNYSKASIQRKALVALQAQLRSDSVVASDLIFDMSFMCLAAVFPGDGNATMIHLNALERLVERMGGIEMVPAYLAELFLFADYHLSTANLTQPIFNISHALSARPPEVWTPNSTLANAGREILRIGIDSELTLRFVEIASDIMRCSQILESVWAHPETLMNAYWMKWKALTMITSITRLELTASDKTTTLLKLETTRLSLLLWVSVLLSTTLLQAGGLRFLPYLKPEAIQRYEKPIQDVLLRWNRAYEQSMHLEVNDTDQAFPQQRRIIRDFETEGVLQLAGFMDAFFALEKVHRGRRASKQERGKISKAVEHSFKSAMGQNGLMFTWHKESPRTSLP